MSLHEVLEHGQLRPQLEDPGPHHHVHTDRQQGVHGPHQGAVGARDGLEHGEDHTQLGLRGEGGLDQLEVVDGRDEVFVSVSVLLDGVGHEQLGVHVKECEQGPVRVPVPPQYSLPVDFIRLCLSGKCLILIN